MKLKNFDIFINESLISKDVTVDQHDIDRVKSAKPDDIGDQDTQVRTSILDAAYSLYSHFDKDRDKSQFVQKVLGLDQDGRERVLNSAKTYVHSLEKIRKIEVDEIEPTQEGLDTIIPEK